jgi:hypothetical protein
MKLAPVILSVVRIGTVDHAGAHRGRSNANNLPPSNSVRSLRIRRPSGELAARWRVSPESGRLECRWSLDDQHADDHLWASLHRTRRRWHRPQRHLPRRGRPNRQCHKPVNKPMRLRFDGPKAVVTPA